MKITKISLQNFRAYDEPFDLDLGDGKNLLLHGENGSGKSSMYSAMRSLFAERGSEIDRQKNLFADEARIQKVAIHLKGTDADGNEYDEDIPWTVADNHPLRVPQGGAVGLPPALRSLLVDAARRSGFLDYRAMLRTNLITKPIPRGPYTSDGHQLLYGAERDGLEAQLFDLVTMVILDGVRVTVSGGSETTIGDLMRDVWRSRPESRHATQMNSAQRACTRFNEAFAAVLPDLVDRTKDLLVHFGNQQMVVTFDPVSLSWNKDSLSLGGAVLIPRILFREGTSPLGDYAGTLNEARLSALAICMFLAGVRMSDNDHENPAHPRFLFLDDALVGLELQNRLPILKILTSDEFAHYQIFLFTHDRVWFELARGHLPCESGWIHQELIGDESTGHLVPKSKPCQEDLVIAQAHLNNQDLKAAAVYARSAFEWKIRNVCEKRGIQLPFKSNPDQIGAGALWDGIMIRQADRLTHQITHQGSPDFVPANLATRVQIIRTNVLNRLSHSGAHGLVTAEVQDAIDTIRDVHNHTFPKP